MEAAQEHERGSSFFRIATWGLGILLLVVVVGVVVQQFRQVAWLQHRDLDEMMTHLQEAGLSLGTADEMTDTLGAQRRVQVFVDGRKVDLLQFDMADKSQKARLEQIRRDEKVTVDGDRRPATINGRFVLIDYSDTPEDDKLVRSFTGFGTPDTTRVAEYGYPYY